MDFKCVDFSEPAIPQKILDKVCPRRVLTNKRHIWIIVVASDNITEPTELPGIGGSSGHWAKYGCSGMLENMFTLSRVVGATEVC